MKQTITIGADPEMFLIQNGEVVPAERAIPGGKNNPFNMGCGSMHYDNILAEINIPPSTNEDEFVSSLQEMLHHVSGFTGCELDFSCHKKFTKGAIKAFGPSALEFGCVPDKYTIIGRNYGPDTTASLSLSRTAGGHVHIGGVGGMSPSEIESLVICLDVLLGLPMIFLEGKDGVERRKLCGALGCYREKPYGIEYRGLSSKWLSEEKYMRFVYNVSVFCAEHWAELSNLIYSNVSLDSMYSYVQKHDNIDYRLATKDMLMSVLRGLKNVEV